MSNQNTEVTIVDVKSSPTGKGAYSSNIYLNGSVKGKPVMSIMQLTVDGGRSLGKIKKLLSYPV